ncbi:MAG: class I SAM-dependent rRNA methyltransferase [Planctomycetota bacterium]|nr:class I SAM-dependent rRNA methyltransferase [Planctomycetota bacterium]
MQHPEIRLDTDLLPQGPWIFGRQVPRQDTPADGALVAVLDWSGRFVGHGLYNGRSDIRVRLLDRGKRSALDQPRAFLQRRLASAMRLRKKLLRLPEVTDTWRLAHAEGDDLSGLIIDRLGPVYVCEHHALGFWNLREDIAWALGQLDPGVPVVHSIPKVARAQEGFPDDACEDNDVGEIRISEHGLAFPVTPGTGHKTGWFCDQRDNRRRVAELSAGKDVLDLFCNAGGFALHAARAGARSVMAVDLDEVALDRAQRAAQWNGLDITFRHQDAFDTLREARGQGRRPHVVILDPHKLVRGKAQLEQGRRKYADLNTLGFEVVAQGGLVATFSCSGAVDLPTFLGIVFQAARRAEREVRLLEVLGAGPDHPQRPDFTRSRYLKGALLAVD